MKTLVIVAMLAAASSACVSTEQAAKSDFIVGGIYWAPADGGGIFVFKLVATR